MRSNQLSSGPLTYAENATSQTPANNKTVLTILAGSVTTALAVALVLNLAIGGSGGGINYAEREQKYLEVLRYDYPGASQEALLSMGWDLCGIKDGSAGNPYEERANTYKGRFDSEDVLALGGDWLAQIDATYEYLCPEIAP